MKNTKLLPEGVPVKITSPYLFGILLYIFVWYTFIHPEIDVIYRHMAQFQYYYYYYYDYDYYYDYYYFQNKKYIIYYRS